MVDAKSKVQQLEKEYYDWLSRHPQQIVVDSEMPETGLEVFSIGSHPLPSYRDRRVIRSPILKLGEWRRGSRVAKFTQEDFDQIVLQFNKQTLGFEPPLFLGHPSDYFASEGAPAVGFLLMLHQRGDVLWGDFEVVSDSAFTAVQNGQYRYASAELIRNTTNPNTGEPVPILLVGHALTNRPFIPDLPRNEAVEHPFVHTYSFKDDPMAEKPTEEMKPTIDSSALEQIKEVFAAQLEAQKREFQEQLDRLKAENEQISQKLAIAEQKLVQAHIEKRLAQLETMNLAKPVKEKYEALVRQQALGEHEEAIFEALQAMSNSMSMEILQQHGQQGLVADTPAKQNLSVSSEEDIPNPYQSQIEENERLAAELRRKAQLVAFGNANL